MRRRDLVSAFAATVAEVPDAELDGLAPASLPADVGADGDEAWGPPPRAGQYARAQQVNLELGFARRREVAEQSLTRRRTAELLGVSDVTVSAWLGEGRLLGLKDGRQWRVPSWQLDPDSVGGVLPGLDRLAAVFAGRVVPLTRWVLRTQPELGGRTGVSALADGDVDRVVTVARSSTAAGW